MPQGSRSCGAAAGILNKYLRGRNPGFPGAPGRSRALPGVLGRSWGFSRGLSEIQKSPKRAKRAPRNPQG
eukprot:6913811-Pyramimonas_sp.AAC.1